jgi:hypothetical protein
MSEAKVMQMRPYRPDTLSNLYVATSRWQMASPRLDELDENGWTANYCLGLLLLGPSRSGKTSMAREWARRRAKAAAAVGETFKTVYVEIPAKGDVPAVAAEVLGALGDPDPGHGTQYFKTTRVAEAVRDQGVKMLVLDEIQRLVDEKGKLRALAASWITGLLNKRVCPILFIGEQRGALVFGQRYLSGRTLGEVAVEAYDWRARDDRKEWRQVLATMSAALQMPEDSGLQETETALRLHSFADGLLGEVARLLTSARSDATRRGLPKLTYGVLADAVDRLRIGEQKRMPNPFRVENPVPGGAAATSNLDQTTSHQGARS